MLDEWMQVIWEKETWWLIMWFVLESVDKAAFPKDRSGEAQERIWPKPAGAETGAERSRYLYGWDHKVWRAHYFLCPQIFRQITPIILAVVTTTPDSRP